MLLEDLLEFLEKGLGEDGSATARRRCDFRFSCIWVWGLGFRVWGLGARNRVSEAPTP